MAFRKKAGLVLKHKPDILVIPECEHPDKLKFISGIPTPTDIIWQGTNQHKGLGVLSYNNYKIKLLDEHNPELKTILPIRVSNGKKHFTLLAVWAYNPADKDYDYIGQVWKAIHYYEELLRSGKVILAGDFNSNVIWDRLKRKTNHSMVVEKLKTLGIHSVYHSHLKIDPGSEKHPTFFLYRHKDKPYHIDYCFASGNFIRKTGDIEIGNYQTWKMHSDHSPLMVSFND
jgi:exodeoxyribonuclease III